MPKREEKRDLSTIPVGTLGIIPMRGCTELAKHVDYYLVRWRAERENEHKGSLAFTGYERASYLLSTDLPRFGSGEGKGVINESVRGDDVYLLVDVLNFSETYKLFGKDNHMSPDDHFQDLKRIIAAVGGKARRITVIMPYLYESRQHKRRGRESLDCAIALQELTGMGVDNIITFEAHDPRVQNAIPLHGFETVRTTYQFIKALLLHIKGLTIDSGHMMVISPDEAGMGRAVYLASVLALDVGMFYKRRDYTTVVNGQNPIVAHEFLGSSVEDKTMIIIDDMISSGEALMDVARQLKKRKAGKIFIFATFGLFTHGLEPVDQAYREGLFDRILTTNLIYQSPELLSREWYISCDMSKYIAYIIDTLNHDASLSELLNPVERIQSIVRRYQNGELENEVPADITPLLS